MADVFDEIRQIISKHSPLGDVALTPETRLDEINIESLDLVEIVFEIEERFKIQIPFNANTESRLEFATVGQIVDGVRSIMANSAAS